MNNNKYNTIVEAKFQYTHAPVDILIPFHGQYHLVGECLKSIITKTLGQKYTITLIDDCSPNKKFMESLKKEKLKNTPIQYIHLEEQMGFGAALKKGFDATINPWVCFLHADCVIEQTDWLLHMLETMQKLKSQGVKLVSAKVDDGGTGSFDSAIIGTKAIREDVIAKDPLPLICTLVNRKLFDHIGFIKPYKFGWFEDEHLFWIMKLNGYKQAVCGKTFVHHEGGATIKELIKDYKTRQIMEENRKLYISDIQEYAHSIRP